MAQNKQDTERNRPFLIRETEAEDWGGRGKGRTEVLLLTFTIEVTRRRKLNHMPPWNRVENSWSFQMGTSTSYSQEGDGSRPQVEIWGSRACLLEVQGS